MSPLAAGIDIEVVRIRDLHQYAVREAAAGPAGGLLPITPWRAAAQAKNPYADPDDPALIVAREAGRVVGYAGSIPGRIATAAGRAKLIYMTSWLVDDSTRGKGVGWGITERLRDEGGLIIATSLSEIGESVMRRRGARDLPSCATIRIRFGDVERMRQRAERVAGRLHLPFLCGAAEAWIRSSQRAAAARTLAPCLAALGGSDTAWRFRRVERLGPEAGACLDAAIRPGEFARDARVVNWMLSDRWVLPTSEATPEVVERYYFAAARDEVAYRAFEVVRAGRVSGCAVFQISRRYGGRVLRLLDHAFSDPESRAALAHVVAHAVAESSPDVLVLSSSAAEALSVRPDGERVTVATRPTFYIPRDEANVIDEMGPENVLVGPTDSDLAFT